MPSASTLRRQIEATLAHRIPSALTPAPRILRPVSPSGIEAVDRLLEGGLPLAAITEVAGPECSGRTTLALSFLAQITQAEKVCAWIDVADSLDPESAAAAGVDLSRLLWVRCGEPPPKQPASPQPRGTQRATQRRPARASSAQPWARIEQGLRAADLVLQAGGFSAIVFDMGGIAPQFALRVPSATWFRYRAAAEHTQASLLLLTQRPCANSSAELLVSLRTGKPLRGEATVFTGIEHEIEVVRRRFAAETTNVVPLRKPPQRVTQSNWQSRPAWAGPASSVRAVSGQRGSSPR